MIKKSITLVLALMFALAMTACGPQNAEEAPVEEAVEEVGLTAEEQAAVQTEEALAAEDELDEENADAEAAKLEAEITADNE